MFRKGFILQFFLWSLLVVYVEAGGSCGTVFSKGDLTGSSLDLEDGDSRPDLKGYSVDAEKVWGLSRSVKVEENCQVGLCRDPFFTGNCTIYNQTLNIIPNDFVGVGSINCTCQSDCQCSKIILRASECGRAYEGFDCNTCQPLYTNLLDEEPDYRESKKVKSILLKPGCSLEAYAYQDFDGEAESITKSIEKFSGALYSYKCNCLEVNKTETNWKPARNIKAPSWINMPSTREELIAQVHENKLNREHPAVQAALLSAVNRRSTKNAYILVLGLSGAGKSSTINLLFDRPNLTQVGGYSSVTKDIHEFTIPIQVDALGLNNSNLVVIDTPGIPDTEGSETDAIFLATLEEYLKSHHELRHRIPNVVLIFGKFHDDRFNGAGTDFVKMLRGLSEFRDLITDDKYSNVIFVLAHYGKVSKVEQKNPGNRINEFKKTIAKFSLFPKPITTVLAETQGRNYNYKYLNSFYKFPNGEYFPRNLFDAIQTMTKVGDPVGGAIIRDAFKNLDDNVINQLDFKRVNRQHFRVGHFKDIIEKANHEVNNTEISKLLTAAEKYLDPKLKESYPGALDSIKWSLNIHNIHTRAEIPRVAIDIVKLFRKIKINQAIIQLLEKGLQLTLPSFAKEGLITGYGYNLFEDKYLLKSPFNLGEYLVSDIGYSVPSAMEVKLHSEVKNIFKLIEDKWQYIKERSSQLAVVNVLPSEMFVGKTKPGYNILGDGYNKFQNPLNGLIEYRTFSLILRNEPDFNKAFLDTINALEPFNKTDELGVARWKRFFEEFGTHVVQQAYGGGSINLIVKGENSKTVSGAKTWENFLNYLNDISLGLNNQSTSISQPLDDLNSEQYSLLFKGGDRHFILAESFSSVRDQKSTSLLESSVDSFSYLPIMLDTELKLLPYSALLRKRYPTKANYIVEATAALFNSTLIHVPKPPQLAKTPVPVRDDGVEVKLTNKINNLEEQIRNFLNPPKTKTQKTTRGDICEGTCKKGDQDYYWCYKVGGGGWDYCSTSGDLTYQGKSCTTPCSYFGEDYAWCETKENDKENWGYCSKDTTHSYSLLF